MCRLAAYYGKPIFLSTTVSDPERSLIDQSRDAEECKTSLNGDGFGVAWYAHRPEPGLYRDVYPAWSDINLDGLLNQVKSHLFLAHVRASTGADINRNNCHPFVVGNWCFMHNGQVGGFNHIRKQVDMLIPDELYTYRHGTTDSEAFFLIAMGQGLAQTPRVAIRKTSQIFANLASSLPKLRLSVVFSDGQRLYAVRHSFDTCVPSLYYSWQQTYAGWSVVSEPFGSNRDEWTAVPPNSFCVFDRMGVNITPLFDAKDDILP
jgi:predicted glutamine amidotransferase